ncbi:SRPBCC family protein [Kordiimonas aestuarii]|uniref:SRPBCC family protein n=1 Tax=Kordiimonas aestuarii TaxID=1005925 RepID=UPI0021D0721E|nr:SRPBCC family protein [Kordiimonas aestuarii]
MAFLSMPVLAETCTIRTYMDAPASLVWSAIRDVYKVHERLTPGFVTDVEAETAADGEYRTITFANGVRLRERIISIDDTAMRLTYGARGGETTHHLASMQVFEDISGCDLVWTCDFLPADLRNYIEGNMERGVEIMKRTLEAEAIRKLYDTADT